MIIHVAFWHPCRGANKIARPLPGVFALRARPPATFCEPFGFNCNGRQIKHGRGECFIGIFLSQMR